MLPCSQINHWWLFIVNHGKPRLIVFWPWWLTMVCYWVLTMVHWRPWSKYKCEDLCHIHFTSFSSCNGYKLKSHLTYFRRGFIAQSVEHTGSNPVGASKISFTSIKWYECSEGTLFNYMVWEISFQNIYKNTIMPNKCGRPFSDHEYDKSLLMFLQEVRFIFVWFNQLKIRPLWLWLTMSYSIHVWKLTEAYIW